MCKQVGLDSVDMEERTIGMCLDAIEEYIEQRHPNKKPPAKRAKQVDFDNF